MKNNLLTIFALFIPLTILISACGESDTKEQFVESSSDQITMSFDQQLADQLGADEYGMKKYVIAFLRSGPNRSQDSVSRAKLQRAHLDNINKLSQEGKLILAGPFLDDGLLRGIYVFDVESVEDAKALTETDPAIQSGSLVMELHPWYGSAAVMKVNEIHQSINKIKI